MQSKMLAVTPIVLAMQLASFAAIAGDDITQAITGGKASLDMRYRYENVDQDSFADEAQASTIRTRLGYTTGDFNDLSAMMEMENTSDAGADDYSPENPGYPTIGDQTQTELNQFYLQFAGIEKTQARIGRQRIGLDNSRFVGNAGWRQNEQTFDAFSVQNESIESLKLFYGFVNNMQTTAGTKADMETHLLNAQYAGLPFGTISVYGYLLDYDLASVGTDTQTFGARFTGKSEIGDGMNLLYSAEYANQADYADSTNIDTDYWLLEGGISVAVVTAKLGYEVLGSDNGTAAFQTPLASRHGFQGWSDVILVTPNTGVEDLYISADVTVAEMVLTAAYHDFAANDGDLDHGDEINLGVSKKFGKNYTLGTKYASYNADHLSVDTDKLWILGEVKF